MKIRFLHLFIFIISISFSTYSAQSQENKKSYYVWAKSGLSIREEAQKKSEKIAVIPYGSKIEIIEISDNELTITVFPKFRYTDNWIKLKYKDYTGYSFKGYISEHKPPAISENSLKSYLNKNYSLTNEVVVKPENCDYAECSVFSFYTYKEGVTYSLSESEISSEKSISIPSLNTLQAFILSTHFCSIDPKAEIQYFDEPLPTIRVVLDKAGCDFTITTLGNFTVINWWSGC